MEDLSNAGAMEEDDVAVTITPKKNWARKMPKKKRKIGRYVSYGKAFEKIVLLFLRILLHENLQPLQPSLQHVDPMHQRGIQKPSWR